MTTECGPLSPTDEASSKRDPQHVFAQKRLQQTYAQVEEVVGIMTLNVSKILQRDEKLSVLDDRADALEMQASQFEQSASKLKNKSWLQNTKLTIAIGLLVVIVVVCVVVYLSI